MKALITAFKVRGNGRWIRFQIRSRSIMRGKVLRRKTKILTLKTLSHLGRNSLWREILMEMKTQIGDYLTIKIDVSKDT